MAVEPFGSASEVQEWFDANSLNNFDMVSTIEDKAIGFAGLFLLPGTQSHVGAISLFVHDEFHGLGIGTLMNARGLMELIIINIGLQRGIITPGLFAILVIMAVVTTFMTSPLFDRLVGPDTCPPVPEPDEDTHPSDLASIP